MSFTDDFFAELNKKKKKEEEKTKTSGGNKYTTEFLSALDDTSDYAPISAPIVTKSRTHSGTSGTFGDDIAPVTKKRTWFTKGAFEDGFDSLLDIPKAILGTVNDVVQDVTAGVGGIFESTIDAGAYVAGGAGKLFGADEFAEKTKNFIKKDIIDEESISHSAVNNSTLGWIENIINGEWEKLDPFYAKGGSKHFFGQLADGDFSSLNYNKFVDDVGTTREDNSLLGDKSDSLAQSGGQLLAQAGLQAVGVPWWVTSAVTSFGSDVEQSFNEDKTYLQAGVSGAISAGAEILTEKLFGGSGLGEKGLINVEMFTKGMSNKAVKALADWGIDVTGEGIEEVASSFITRLGDALIVEREDTVKELLTNEEAMDNFISQVGNTLFGKEAMSEYGEAFIGGAVLGGIANAGKVKRAKDKGIDYRTDMTANEEAVVEKYVDKAIKEAESKGKKLTKKEKAEIRESVIEQMDTGQLDIDEIESMFGGEEYKAYKETVENEDKLKAELAELRGMETGKRNDYQNERMNELKDMNLDDTTKRDDLRKRLDEKLSSAIGKDSRLAETFREKARKSQAFEADLSQYKGKQKEAVERAINSGVLNNTYKSHKLVDTLSQIEADKGITFDYANNEKIKELGFAVEGKTVNGVKQGKNIILNVQSHKAWQSTVGHEIGHVLESTGQYYTELRNSLYAYAESKGELESRRADLTELYKDMDADIEAELTADLLGDYLFSDAKFINSLTSNRNLFQRIYDEIKYLCKVATGKQLTEIEKVKHEFDRAWKQIQPDALTQEEKNAINGINEEAQDTEVDDVQHSISVTDEKTLNSLNEQVARGEYNAETNPDGGYYVTYKSMSFWGYDDEGNAILRSPMAEYVDGELSNAYLIPKDKSKLNWYQATETLDEATGLPSGLMVKVKKPGNKSFTYLPAAENQDLIAEDWSNLYFNLQKKVLKNGKWVKSDVPARYNPYEHSSNSMLNDQFSAAYLRDNLVTVKMYVPVSEDNGAFRAKWSKDPTGWADWKTGTVAGKINKQKDLQRRVYLSRYAAPVEIVPDSEVAQAYKEYLDGTDVTIPDNVVSPNLLKELKNAGVPITESGKVTNKGGVEYDKTSKSYSPVRYSISSWSESDYVTERNSAAKDMAKTLGVTTEKASKYIDDVNSIAKIIADDKVRIAYEPSPNRSAFVSNAEYGGSIDFSTICKKRRLFTGTFEAIQNALPNTALTAEEVLEIRKMIKDKGYEVSCGLCYVEGSRTNMGQYTKQFIERYKAINPEYVPNMAEMNTATGQEKIRKEHPEVYEAYEYFMNHYGRLSPTDKAIFASQQKPKMYQMSTEYKGEVLDNFGKQKGSVEAKNKNGGLRLQSFSDFEIIHLIDSMQVIMDMSRVGLAGQAYTKVPDFAWALGDTGLKINLSLIAKGVDENGRLILDEVEGMKESDAMALRDRYSDNVGTIIVTFNDEQLKAAMADERIDYIIPYHRSQWKTDQYELMGLPENTKDYTSLQNESYIEAVYNKNGKKQRPNNYMPNTYWDFNKSGKENAEAYLQMCAENNRKPKFSHLLVDNQDGSYSLQPDGSTDGYWKTLIDFKMYNNEGIGVPQNPVKPDFNMDEARRMLNEYNGGHAKFPVAQDIVNEFVSKHPDNIAPTDVKYSLSSETPLDQRLSGDALLDAEDLIAEIEGVAEVSPNGYVTLYHRTTEDNAKKIIKTGKMSAKEDGIFFSTQKDGAYSADYGDSVVELKVPVEKLVLDDIFDSEAHLRIPLKNRNEVLDVSAYLPTSNTSADIQYSLSEDSEGNTLTLEQQKKFENSKTRDANGNLIPLYHGSESIAFTEFDMKKGVWLATDQRYSEVYAGQWHSWRDDDPELAPYTRRDLNGLEPEVYTDPDYRVYKVYADIQNPLDIGEVDGWLSDGKVGELARALGVRYSELKAISDNYMEERTYALTRSEEFIELAKSKGFDGLKATESGKETWCAIKSADQIKLTTNQNPTADKDVRYSISPKNAPPAPKGTRLSDFALEQNIAPTPSVEGTVSKTETVDNAPNLADIAPLPDEQLEQGTYENIRPKPESQPRMVRADNVEQERTAEILTEEPQVKKKKRGIFSKAIANFVDKGAVFENLSLKTKNRALQDKYKSIGRSETKAQYFMENGTEGVKSLDSIRSEVESAGLTKSFYEYLYHKHNVDRMSMESKEESNLNRLKREMQELKLNNLKENQLRAIASEKITDETKPHRARLIQTVREYLASKDVKNKPVFGDSVTAEMSQNIADELEATNPILKEYAQDVYNYMNHLRTMMVENGVISQETADLWAEMYPHYVPIRRLGDDDLSINVPLDTNRTGINAPIKRATGGNRDILPLFDTMAQRTIQTFKAIDKNRFGIELKNTLGSTVENTATNLDEVIDSIDAQEGLLQEGKNGKNPTFTVFENGERVTFEITEDMYDALKPTSKGLSYTNKVLNTASNLHRGVLTEFNPVFMANNAIKDTQDVLINSQHPARTYANFPVAIKELAAKGKWYKEYMENGGGDNTYFDKQSNTFNKEKSTFRKVIGFPLDKISQANNFIEKVPRLAEYIASRKNGSTVDGAMLDAARVTTDFSAGGDVTKFLNRNGATFLNASVQGFAQQVRNVREAKANGLKGWLGLAAKVTLAGLPAILLNGLLWDDDEEYEELSDYVKENYYVVAKYGDGKFIRIPKGRTTAVIQNAFEQVRNTLTGDDEADFGRFFELVMSNLAPNNPIDNNIIAPIKQVIENKTWYGEDLVPTRLQDLPAAEQYDESTDSISKWLGETLNVSPYKINYLLNQYGGGVADVVLPMLTPEAESGDSSIVGNLLAPMKDKFTTDGVMNNQNVSDFYNTVDELTTNAKSSGATDDDILKYKYMNSVSTDIGKLYAEKREIQNNEFLSDSEKYNRAKEIQKQINSLAKESLNSYSDVAINGNYATVGDRHYKMNDEGEWQKVSDEQLDKQNEVTSALGISPSDYWANKEEYDYAYKYPENYAVAKAVGGYDSYKAYSSELYDIKADKDEYGKSINGSRKEKVLDYINNLNADYETKIILWKSEYPSDDTYNVEIIEYLNNREDLTYEDRVSILTELGFKVSNGEVYWD